MRIALLVIVLAGCDIYDPKVQPPDPCPESIVAGGSCVVTGVVCDVPQGVDGGSFEQCACRDDAPDGNRWTCFVGADAGVN